HISGFSAAACGPSEIGSLYFDFYLMMWDIIQIFTTCLAPTGITSIVLIDIFINIRVRKRILATAAHFAVMLRVQTPESLNWLRIFPLTSTNHSNKLAD
ncbi:unnamed protein product, partial [Rotaria magnacalcarata]